MSARHRLDTISRQNAQEAARTAALLVVVIALGLALIGEGVGWMLPA